MESGLNELWLVMAWLGEARRGGVRLGMAGRGGVRLGAVRVQMHVMFLTINLFERSRCKLISSCKAAQHF